MTSRVLPTWFVFLLLGFFWGSSYFWIKLGVETIPPLTLVAMRLFFGFLVVGSVVLIAREPLPRSPRQYGHLLVMSIINVVLPFFLITWGEQSPSMDSALASILNATVPLFVLVIAPMFLPDERITLPRVAGLVIGFLGVVVLFAPSLVNLSDNDFLAEGALVASSISYAFGNVYAKRNVKGLRPMIPALFQISFALIISTILALILEQPIGRVSPAPIAWVAVIWLGTFGSGLAYLGYFRVLHEWGATRTALVAYLLPIFGIGMGALRGEAVTVERVAGTVLIIGGVALVNSASSLPFFRRSATKTALHAPVTPPAPATPARSAGRD
jgi:drug/metabolite transporter (DMT)-like permease